MLARSPSLRRSRYTGVISALTVLAALTAAQPALAQDDPRGFVRDRISLKQDVKDLLRGGFVEELICKEDCTVDGRLVISPVDAKRLGFKGVRRGKWFEIGAFKDVRLEALKWTKVPMPLSAKAKRVLRRAKEGVRINGENVATSLESGRYGWATWIRTCPWPKG